MEFDELIKTERELTGVTQSLFSENTNKKYGMYGVNLTPRMINTIEHSGSIFDEKLRNVFLNHFYFIDIEREKQLLSFAYMFADYTTNKKRTGNKKGTSSEIVVDVKELFSFTRKEELFLFIIDSIEERSNGNILEKMVTKESIQKYIEEDLADISDEISLKYVNITNSNGWQGLVLNDSAKLVFYIAYYQLLLSHKKKNEKDKILIKGNDCLDPEVKEAIAPFTNEDDFDEKTGKVKGKILKSINKRISLFMYIFENGGISDSLSNWQDVKELLPDDVDIPDFSQLCEEIKKIDFENIDYNDKTSRWVIEQISELGLFSIKDILLQCYSLYQYQYPSMKLVEDLNKKIKDLKISERTDDARHEFSALESVVSDIVKKLRSMYEENKGKFTLEQFGEFLTNQRFLFQLYRKYEYAEFLLFKNMRKKA